MSLTSLAVSSGRLSPAFSSSQTEYTVTLNNRPASLTLTAVMDDLNESPYETTIGTMPLNTWSSMPSANGRNITVVYDFSNTTEATLTYNLQLTGYLKNERVTQPITRTYKINFQLPT